MPHLIDSPAAFTNQIARWFEKRGFIQINRIPHDKTMWSKIIQSGEELNTTEAIESVLEASKKPLPRPESPFLQRMWREVSSPTPGRIAHVYRPEFEEALQPLLWNAGALGYRINFVSAHFLLVSYGDEVPAEQMFERLGQQRKLAEPLAELMLRIIPTNFEAPEPFVVFHILQVYFRHENYMKHVIHLPSLNSNRRFRAGFASVKSGDVVWQKYTLRWLDKIGHGHAANTLFPWSKGISESGIFNGKDLEWILSLQK